MLGIAILYFIGKSYFDLCKKYDQNYPWGYAILAIAIHYGTTFLFGVVAILLAPEFFLSLNEHIFALISIPFGVLAVYIIYKLLEKKFKSKKDEDFSDDFLLDDKF